MAAAGVDASNVSVDEIALLPVDPDVSALTIRLTSPISYARCADIR